MKYLERLQSDLKEAMKARDAERVSVLRGTISALKYRGLESGAKNELSEEEEIQVVRKLIKQREESAESFDKGGRPELAAKERAESALLSSYLPQALSPAELEQLVTEAIQAVGATDVKDMGRVMKEAGTRVAGRADGKSLSNEVKRQLQG